MQQVITHIIVSIKKTVKKRGVFMSRSSILNIQLKYSSISTKQFIRSFSRKHNRDIFSKISRHKVKRDFIGNRQGTILITNKFLPFRNIVISRKKNLMMLTITVISNHLSISKFIISFVFKSNSISIHWSIREPSHHCDNQTRV